MPRLDPEVSEEFLSVIRQAARVHVANAGFPVYPSFHAGATALGRVRAYYEELEARTK